MEATFKHGDPLFVDYTPGSAVDAGDVVVLDSVPFVAHSDIAASELGAVAARGGVYTMTADAEIAAGDKVYWDSSASKITISTDTGANKHFGFVAPGGGSSADGDPIIVIHAPDGTAI